MSVRGKVQQDYSQCHCCFCENQQTTAMESPQYGNSFEPPCFCAPQELPPCACTPYERPETCETSTFMQLPEETGCPCGSYDGPQMTVGPSCTCSLFETPQKLGDISPMSSKTKSYQKRSNRSSAVETAGNQYKREQSFRSSTTEGTQSKREQSVRSTETGGTQNKREQSLRSSGAGETAGTQNKREKSFRSSAAAETAGTQNSRLDGLSVGRMCRCSTPRCLDEQCNATRTQMSEFPNDEGSKMNRNENVSSAGTGRASRSQSPQRMGSMGQTGPVGRQPGSKRPIGSTGRPSGSMASPTSSKGQTMETMKLTGTMGQPDRCLINKCPVMLYRQLGYENATDEENMISPLLEDKEISVSENRIKKAYSSSNNGSSKDKTNEKEIERASSEQQPADSSSDIKFKEQKLQTHPCTPGELCSCKNNSCKENRSDKGTVTKRKKKKKCLFF